MILFSNVSLNVGHLHNLTAFHKIVEYRYALSEGQKGSLEELSWPKQNIRILKYCSWGR